MQFWFVSHFNLKIRLPVPPPEFTVETGRKVNVVEVNDFGEYSIPGDTNLTRITFSTFFPAQEYHFVQHRGFRAPYDNVKIIEAWEKSKEPIRFFITDTKINKLFYIESFRYGEKAGSRDVEFEITLVEHRPIEVSKKGNSSNKPSRPASQPSKPKTHTMREGDTLWSLARKYYDDPYRWTEIKKKNNIKDERKIPIGKVLIIP